MRLLERTLVSSAILVTLCCVHCSNTTNYYSILHSSPYIDYSSRAIPETSRSASFGRPGAAVLVGLDGGITTTDADTSVVVALADFTGRASPLPWLETGFTAAALYEHEFFPYFAGDMKLTIVPEPIIVAPIIGLGTGMGRAAWSVEVRGSLLLGFPVIKNTLTLYAVPKIMDLEYCYARESEGLGRQFRYAGALFYGFSAGVSYVLTHLESSARAKHGSPRLALIPEATVMWGREPVLDEIRLTVFQFGIRLALMN